MMEARLHEQENYEAKILRRIMADFRISNAELSRLSGVPYQSISKFRGGEEISRKNFVKLINSLPAGARREYVFEIFHLEAV